ncbi:toxin-antitoxin system YwqK family antitoxin [Spirosoma radiotolerans]|uniref:TonB C-terminal domain-containing protein n=1 Tax=Spirosoma radiotolerans TaxID=1379870 RepID=A0A0E3ZV14_9BACT|nr:hypothetical protein [Spirosoma radiotolerans]AKD54859.1 hypothetical protein SD10_08025 [Spirosoma radiotolerans]
MKTCLLLIFLSVFTNKSLKAQNSLASSIPAITQHDGYFEKLTYLGANQDYYTVSTFLTDSTLYRVDTYRLIDRVNPYTSPATITKVATHQGQTKIFYPTGQVYLTCEYSHNVLHGPLVIYYADGSIKRRERYKSGDLLTSQCYTLQGDLQTCDLLYRAPQFMGKPNQLKRYLTQRLQALAQREQVRDITITLTINELGQIAKTDVKSYSNPANSELISSVLEAVQAMPRWKPNHFNWQPATMDGVAIEEAWTIDIRRKQGFLYVYLPHS